MNKILGQYLVKIVFSNGSRWSDIFILLTQESFGSTKGNLPHPLATIVYSPTTKTCINSWSAYWDLLYEIKNKT